MSGKVPEQHLIPSSTLPSQLVPRGSEGESPLASAEWLDKHPRLPYLVLATVPFLVVLPLWLFHLSADPIWSFSGVVRDVGLGIFRGGLPFGDPHVGWTSQALGHLAAWQWIHAKVPWWNHYSGIGMPLAGEMQPGAFFLPFVLLLLFRSGFIWLRIAMQLVAGFSTFALLRELELGRLAALVGGLLFELCGTFAWTRGPDSFFCAAAFLPLLLLGIEQMCKREREHTGTLWVALGIAFSILAGFPEAAYIDGLLALVWSICRFATLEHRWRFALRLAWGGLLGLLLSAPLLAGFWSFLTESPAVQAHPLGHKALSPEAVPLVFLPYVYGNHPGNSELNGWSDLGGYAGILVFFFALLGFRSKRPFWLRTILIAWVGIAWAKTFGVQPVMALMNRVPFILEAAFYRYSPPSWELCLIILAAFGIEELRYRKPPLRLAGLLTLAALAISIGIAWPWRAVWGWQPGQIAAVRRYLVFGVGWAVVVLACSWLLLRVSRGEKRRLSLAAVLALNAGALFIVPLLSSVRPGSLDRPAIGFLQAHLGLSRFHTAEPIQPNYSAYFGVASIEYAYFPVPTNFLNYVTQRLFPPLPKTTGAIFWPAWPWYGPDAGLNYLWEFLPEYETLGVKYVVADSGGPDTLEPEAAVPTASQGNEVLPLQPGQQAQFTVSIPAVPGGSATEGIRSAALFLGNYANSSDGNLDVRVCANGTCAEGSRPLSQSADNSFFYISFAHPLAAAPGTAVSITTTHTGGTKPVALWIWPDLPQQNENLFGPDGKPVPGKAIRVSFSFDLSSGGLPRVYHDSMIDIFELPHPAPYYSIESGGPCRLNSVDRDSVHAVCDAPAVLIRRELYMPGWHASLNGKHVDAESYGEIFQSYNLPRGDFHLRFAYLPPYAKLAGCGSLFALAALVLEFLIANKSRAQVRRDVAPE